jgi:hypothetical protein
LVYLLDSDALIRADRQYYPPNRFPIFWTWLFHMGISGSAKVPREQYEEIVSGRGGLVDWLRREEVKQALLLAEDADPALVAEVTLRGYGQLDEVGLEKVGRDPFLIAYAFAGRAQRTVVTLEVSALRRQGANRKIPDVCAQLGIACCDLFEFISALDFTTDWRP